MARYDMVRSGTLRQGTAGGVRRGMASYVSVRHGQAGEAGFVTAGRGMARLVKAGKEKGGNFYMVYQWKTLHFSVDAQTAGEELERIQTKSGSLTPQAVVEESRMINAVLHPCFEWDNSKAAEQYREHQARILVGNIVTVEVNGQQQEPPVRAFVNITDSETQNREYKSIDVVLSRRDYTQQMLESAMKELNNFTDKYSALSELSEVFEAISHL